MAIWTYKTHRSDKGPPFASHYLQCYHLSITILTIAVADQKTLQRSFILSVILWTVINNAVSGFFFSWNNSASFLHFCQAGYTQSTTVYDLV